MSPKLIKYIQPHDKLDDELLQKMVVYTKLSMLRTYIFCS